MRLRLGSLFSGFGGLDMAIEAAFRSIGVEVDLVWVSDIEQHDKKGRKIGDAPAILAYRYPGVPNLGDITSVDWAKVPGVHIIGGGSPCQDVSTAGKLAGMTEGTRSNLWVEMREAIRILQPAFVVWENVPGALSAKASSRRLPEHLDRAITHHQRAAQETSHAPTRTRHARAALRLMERRAGHVGVAYPQPALRAFGRVLGDLAELGFDAEWVGISASDIGGCHGRRREFVLAAHPERIARLEWQRPATGEAQGGGHSVQLHDVIEHLTAADADNLGRQERRTRRHEPQHAPTPSYRLAAADPEGQRRGEGRTEPAGIVGGSDAAERGATPADTEDDRPIRAGTPRVRGHGSADGCNASAAVALLPTPSAINPNDGESLASWEARRDRVKVTARNGNGMGTPLSIAVRMLPTPSVVDATGGHGRRGGDRGDERLLKGIAAESAWGPYAEAIARWEAIHGPAPAPTKTGKKGCRKLNPEFASWMMGAPPGWITDVPGLTDSQASHAIGNGVVPHQGAAALRILLDRISRWDVA